MLKKQIGNIQVEVKFHDVVSNPWGEINSRQVNHHNKYKVKCVNLDTNEEIFFSWYDSIHATINYPIEHSEVLDGVLSCVRSDYFITSDNYPTFEDFASEFGYDEDSRKAERTYIRCVRHGDKLHKVFSEEVIETLPE